MLIDAVVVPSLRVNCQSDATETAHPEMLMAKGSRPGLLALACFFRCSCPESNPAQKCELWKHRIWLRERRKMTWGYARGVDGISEVMTRYDTNRR